MYKLFSTYVCYEFYSYHHSACYLVFLQCPDKNFAEALGTLKITTSYCAKHNSDIVQLHLHLHSQLLHITLGNEPDHLFLSLFHCI